LKQGHYAAEVTTEDGGLATNFFRSHSESDDTDRETNFVSYTNAGTLETFDTNKQCAPMNPDRFYRILTRRRFHLAGARATAGESRDMLMMGKNMKKFSKYYRINKVVHWRDTAAETNPDVEMPIIEV